MCATLWPGDGWSRRYRVLDLIGQGGVGSVYRGLDLQRHETVALKRPASGGSAVRARLHREALLLTQLRHPSIPRARDFVVERSQPVLVMEYVAGEDLALRLARRGRPFAVRTALAWADQVLDVLIYLHARGIFHHDIKPQNLKLGPGGRIMLLDFGLAGTRGPAGYTASYAPPEQVGGAPTSPQSDLYAVGATLYELLARRAPPPALQRLRDVRMADLSALNPAVSLQVSAVITGALGLEPGDRPASARAMQTALRSVMGTCPPVEATEHESPAPALATHVSDGVADSNVTHDD
jgi:serine/threonine-protein kinase